MIIDSRAFTLGRPTVVFVPARLGVEAKAFSLGKPDVTLVGNYNSDIPDLSQYANVRLGRLRNSEAIVTPERFPATKFQHDYQRNVETTEAAIRALATNVINIGDLVEGLLATQRAIAEVQQQTAANTAETQAQTQLQRVRDSYADPNPLTAENVGGSATINIASHNRKYLDPIEAVPVNAGSITGLGAGTLYFVYYDDPELVGGAVTYLATPTEEEATTSLTNPYRHKIGSILTSSTPGGGTSGTPSQPPWQITERILEP